MANLRGLKIDSEQVEAWVKQAPKVLPYQDYSEIHSPEEVRYFAQLTIISLLTSLLSFIFLALEWTPLMALSLASSLSLAAVRIGKWLIDYIKVAYQHPSPSPKTSSKTKQKLR